jgi:hypothetical protein
LLIVARDDSNDEGPRLPRIRAWFHKARQPKKLVFSTARLMRNFYFRPSRQTA